MIRAFGGIRPRIAASAYVDPSAQVIGDVEIGERSSIWPNVVLRADVSGIRIAEESNVQDNCVLHGDVDKPVSIGSRVTIGHSAVIHGCELEDGCLIGIGATVLNGARIGKGSVIAAASLVPEGMQIPPESMVRGVPAKVKRQVTEEEKARFDDNCAHYVRLGQALKDEQQ